MLDITELYLVLKVLFPELIITRAGTQVYVYCKSQSHPLAGVYIPKDKLDTICVFIRKKTGIKYLKIIVDRLSSIAVLKKEPSYYSDCYLYSGEIL